MSQIAGFRGALWNSSSVELAKVVAAPIVDPKTKLTAGELVRDPGRAVYRYHQGFDAGTRVLVRKSWFAAIALEPWGAQIKPHEETDAKARAAAIAGIAATGIHTDAVLAGYRDAAGEIDRLFRKIESERPIVDVTTADGTNHKLWRANNAELIGKLRPLCAPKPLHVLDGHARYEGMLAYRDKLDAATPLAQYSSAKYGLACLVNLDDPALAVGARHRIARGDGLTKQAVLAAAAPYFIVEPIAGAAKDVGKQLGALATTIAHQPAFVATFAGDPDAYKLTLSPDVSPAALGAGIHRAIQKYDSVIVEHVFRAKAAPSGTWQTALDAAAVVAAVAGGASIGLVLRPLSIDQISHANEQGALLPFGSTSFHPQVARLVSYFVDSDEDLL
ncbi:MAG TPA: DUF1015 family protein [Kofleriaceae bacterium]|jgi:uncharacterized protein (DUF1015 family)|nr:DUF1015 family protein [Kofleriaceae bacterium]